MLPKENRLRLKREFQKVFESGARLSYGHFHALVYKRVSDVSEPSKFGIIVGKKVDKKAVNRNRIKRRQREALRNFINDFPTGYDVIIFPHRNVLKCKFESLLKEVGEFILGLKNQN